jgi:hypothetical protein
VREPGNQNTTTIYGVVEWARDFKSKNPEPNPIMMKIWLEALANAILDDDLERGK